jgi:molybdopterin-guanine dinucleotide biosynthesis protein B
MKAFVAVSGLKNSGKTTLCLDLASRLENMGIRVGFVKRTHEAILGTKGTDTGFFLGQGIPTILWGPDGIRGETREIQPELEWLVDRLMPDVDLVLLEGGKDLPLPRIWVGPPGDCPEGVGGVLAWYSREVRTEKVPSFGPGEEEQLARLLVERLVRGKDFPAISLHVDGRKVFLKPYLAKFLQESIQGMLRSLKDTEGRDISIHIRMRDIPEL